MTYQSLLIFSLALGACARGESAPRQASGRPGDLVVRRGNFEQILPLTGEIDAVAAAELKVPRVPSGKVTIRSLALEGAEVKKDDIVAELDSTAYVAQVKEKLLALNQSEIDLERQASQNGVAEADKALDVELKRAVVKRAEIDADVPVGILPKRDYLEKQMILRRAKVDLEKSEEALVAQRKVAELDLSVKRLSVDKIRRTVKTAEEGIVALTLRAPGDGTIILGEHWNEGRKLQEADDVWMGMTVIRISDTGARRVKAWLSDVDDGRVTVGMGARVTLDAYPEKLFHGKVVEVSPVAREASVRSQRRAFTVGIELMEDDVAVLRPGLSARVDVISETQADALLVSRLAINMESHPPQAYLATGGSTTVKLGPCGAELCVVTGGVEEGTRLRRAVP